MQRTLNGKCLTGTFVRAVLLGLSLLSIPLMSGCLDPGADGNLVPKTADEDPSIPSLRMRGSVFHVESFGADGAPLIVMLHGGPGGDYRSLLRLRNAVDGKRLEDTHEVVFWDQRGTGLSQRHDAKDVTMDVYDTDLTAVIDHFAPGRQVVLIGHSWGGMFATRYIQHHPERVAGAVLMEPGPLTGKLFIEKQNDIHHVDFFSEWLNDYTWAEQIVSPDDHARADYLFALGSFGDQSPGYHTSSEPEPFWRLGAVSGAAIQKDGNVNGKPGWDFTIGLDRFTTKVLFEASANNTVIGAEFQRRQMQFYPNAELTIIPNAGHDFEWTQADASLRPVFAYLAAIGF